MKASKLAALLDRYRPLYGADAEVTITRITTDRHETERVLINGHSVNLTCRPLDRDSEETQA